MSPLRSTPYNGNGVPWASELGYHPRMDVLSGIAGNILGTFM